MSRPQFNNQRSTRYAAQGDSHSGGGVVNGGLIDFQDNSMRGIPAEYSHPAMVQAEYPASSYMTPAVLQGLAATGAGGAAVSGCFTGPPSFLHVNGVTYRPVDPVEPRLGVAAPATLTPTPAVTEASVVEPSPSGGVGGGSGNVGVNTKILSKDELNRIVDERVRQRVSAQVQGYMTRKPAALDMDTGMEEVGSHRHCSSKAERYGRDHPMDRPRYDEDRDEEPLRRHRGDYSRADVTERERYDDGPEPRARVERARYDHHDSSDPSSSPRGAVDRRATSDYDSDRRGVRAQATSTTRRNHHDSGMETTAAEIVRSANASMNSRLGGRQDSYTSNKGMRW